MEIEYFKISMKNVKIMQTFETNSDLNEGFPNKFLIEVLLDFLLIYNLLIEIPIIWKLHHYTK